MGQTPHFKRETASNKGVSSPKQACSVARWLRKGCRPDNTPRCQLRRLRGPGRRTCGLFSARLSSHALPTAVASAACPDDQCRSPRPPTVTSTCVSFLLPSAVPPGDAGSPSHCAHESQHHPRAPRPTQLRPIFCCAVPASTAMRPQQQHWGVPRRPAVRSRHPYSHVLSSAQGQSQLPTSRQPPVPEAVSALVSVCRNQGPHTGRRKQHQCVLSRFWRPEAQNHGVTGPRAPHCAPPEQTLPPPPALWWLWPHPSSLYPCFHVASPPMRTLVIRFGAQIIRDDLITSSLT